MTSKGTSWSPVGFLVGRSFHVMGEDTGPVLPCDVPPRMQCDGRECVNQQI